MVLVMVEVVVGWTVVVSMKVFEVRGPLDRMVLVMEWRAVSSLTWKLLIGRVYSGDMYREDGVFCRLCISVKRYTGSIHSSSCKHNSEETSFFATK
jgi:hypothetical protein